MSFEPVYLFYGAVFLGALLLVEGLYYLIADNLIGRRNVNRRMTMLASGTESREVLEKLRRKAVRRTHAWGAIGDLYFAFDRLITQSGLTIPTKRMLAVMAALSSITFLGLLGLANSAVIPVMFASPFVAGALAITIGVVFPLLHLLSLKGRRLKRFGEQLPDALDVMVRSLQAGHPVSAAMALVTKEMPDPIGTEFGLAVDEMTYGLELREALEKLGARVGLQDFQYVVVSINIQHETGGNLAEVLTGLSSVIRGRFRMFKKIRALSGEGRVSAILLSVLPFATGGLIFTLNSEFYLGVVDDPLFLPLLGGAFGLMLSGIFLMYRMVKFRV